MGIAVGWTSKDVRSWTSGLRQTQQIATILEWTTGHRPNPHVSSFGTSSPAICAAQTSTSQAIALSQRLQTPSSTSPHHTISPSPQPRISNKQMFPLHNLFGIITRSAQTTLPALRLLRPRHVNTGETINFGVRCAPGAVLIVPGWWTTKSRIVNGVRNSVESIRFHCAISDR
jgi:hypothetical protein